MMMGRIISVFPENHLFRLKVNLYNKLGGLFIDPTAQIYSSVRFHTYPIIIGARSHIGSRVLFSGANGCTIEIGDDCDVAPDVVFLTGTHEIGMPPRRAGRGIANPIKVSNGTWIGARSLILPGVVVGECSIIAAGSVVNRDIPPNTLAAGVPAIIKKELPIQ
jgi:maltose O-acetyltransferase